ncbi:hypothetical protein PAXRUDRAFT_179854, partial [Paxillus rubicundulus Ve08.2h10]
MKGSWFTRNLWLWSKAYILDREDLPWDTYGDWKMSRVDDENLAAELHLHLQSVGKYVKANDLVQYLSDPEVQQRFELKKTISLATTKRWMHKLGYRWLRNHCGQYVDGHERPDVVDYWQSVFIPNWKAMEVRMRQWSHDGITEEKLQLPQGTRLVIAWRHDESTFYANERRHSGWVHVDVGADPQPKGEGESIMVSDFISPEYGWCRSPDAKESARVIFRAGKAWDGYYTCDDVLAQTSATMDLLQKHYPDSDHVFIFDNASTHLKRAEDALSARHMPKRTQDWGVDATVRDKAGKAVNGPNGKLLKTKVQMSDGYLPNGRSQPLYFPKGHAEHAGKFKGMAQLLKERGFTNAEKLKVQCKDFKCKEGATNCCCR